MRVKQISYSMLRKTKMYENDRAEAVIEFDEQAGENVGDAVKLAKKICERALATTDYEGF